MKAFLLLLTFCCCSLSKEVTKRTSTVTMELGEGLEPCTSHGESEISSVEPLVHKLFNAYKTQAQSETPPGRFSQDIQNADGHEVLGRLFVYIYNTLEHRFKNPFEELPELAQYIFEQVEANEARWADDRTWPFRCYDVNTAKALDLFLSTIAKLLNEYDVLVNYRNETIVHYGLVLDLPAFQKYSKNIPRVPFTSICEIVKEKQEHYNAIRKTKIFVETMSPLATVACHPPHNVSFYCKFDLFYANLKKMEEDYERAGDSTEMQNFAFYWFYDSPIAKECDFSGSNPEFLSQVITPHGRLALARLKEIISLSSTTGPDLEKMRTFIYDYSYNHYTRRAEEYKRVHGAPHPPMDIVKYVGFSNFLMLPHERPKKNLVLFFRVWMSVLLEIEKTLVEGGDVSDVKALARFAMFWFLHPDFSLGQADNYDIFSEGLVYIMERSSLLMKSGKAINIYPWDEDCEGEVTDTKWRKFCQLYRVLVDIRSYAITSDNVPLMKIVNPSSGYKKILELESMRSLETQIAALQIGQAQLEQNLLQMRTALGDHFHQLATFDQDKAEYDVGYLQDKIADFTERIQNSGFGKKLTTLMKLTIGSNFAEVTQLGVQLAAQVVSNYNPLAWLSGAGGINDILDRANDLAIAGVNTAKLIYIFTDILPNITTLANKLAAARAGNAVIHDKLNVTFHALKNKEEIDIGEVQSNFLIDYRSYDPGWSQGDIAEYTVFLQQTVESLCDILYGGETVASAVSQGIGATKAVCLKIKTDAEVLDAIYNEMYDFQYEFMDAMAAAIRALVSKHSANKVRNLPDEEADDRPSYLAILKLYASQLKLQSKHYILVALKNVCDLDEYKNGGVQTTNCQRALSSPTTVAINQVIGEQVLECPADKVKWFDVRIPARSNPDKTILEPGVIDLTKLYAGKPTKFQIPFGLNTGERPWVQKFISDTIPAVEDIALYLKRFELYLPDTTDSSSSFVYDVEIRVNQNKAGPIMQGYGETKYGFGSPKVFTFNYGENKETCTNGFKDTAYPKLCEPYPSQICISSPGVVSENEVAPPLYSEWLIHASLPGGFTPVDPIPDSIFYLRASFEICQKNPKNIELPPQPIASGTTRTGLCCDEGKYFYISDIIPSLRSCVSCPQNSTPKLGGLYCHKNPPEEPTKHHIRWHMLRHRGHFNRRFLGWKRKHKHNNKVGKYYKRGKGFKKHFASR